ncbi:MAG: hypothetical protein JXR59_11460 [Desulfuromonadaceae bacterium]|nr:hypothetical protein [Desulfuromonadaceae bacterium]
MNFFLPKFSWLQAFHSQADTENLSRFELEARLEADIARGCLRQVRKTLDRLQRDLFQAELLLLADRCLQRGKFVDAFWLATRLRQRSEQRRLLEDIVRAAARGDDVRTARWTALYLERLT